VTEKINPDQHHNISSNKTSSQY